MEIKPGYKQTEVGVIPEEWDVVNLECAAGIIDPQPDHRTPPECAGGDPYIGISDFIDDYAINWEGSRKIIPRAVDRQRARFNVRSGDIIFGKIGTIGMPKFVPNPQIRYGLSANVLLLQPRVEPSFLMAWLRSDTFQRAVNAELHSTSQAAFGINKMRRMFITTPPESEQRVIAEALTDVDALLVELDRLITKKRDLKQATMQQLLTGQTRLPGFHREWEVKTLGELFEITSSKRVFQSEWRSEGIPFYRARELAVLGQTGRVRNEIFISRELYQVHRRTYGVPSVGDMLVTGVGTLGRVYVVSDDREFYFKDGNIIWFKIAGKISAEFLRQLYLTDGVMKQVAEGGAGTTVRTYTISAAKKTTIPFPALAEQTAIAEVLTEMDAEIAALEQRREKTRALKQAMMQELLTGKTRLI